MNRRLIVASCESFIVVVNQQQMGIEGKQSVSTPVRTLVMSNTDPHIIYIEIIK